MEIKVISQDDIHSFLNEKLTNVKEESTVTLAANEIAEGKVNIEK